MRLLKFLSCTALFWSMSSLPMDSEYELIPDELISLEEEIELRDLFENCEHVLLLVIVECINRGAPYAGCPRNVETSVKSLMSAGELARMNEAVIELEAVECRRDNTTMPCLPEYLDNKLDYLITWYEKIVDGNLMLDQLLG